MWRGPLVCALTIICLAAGAEALVYNVTWSPQRMEINKTDTLDVYVQLRNFSQPQGRVEVGAVSYYQGPILLSDGDKCQVFNVTSTYGSPYESIKLLECSPHSGRFAFRIYRLHKFIQLYVSAKAQQPPMSQIHPIGFQRPSGLRVISFYGPLNIQHWTPGQTLEAMCNFIGGVRNLANFTWYVSKSPNAPKNVMKIENGQDWHSFTIQDHGHYSTLTGMLGPGDDGIYTCVANYLPREVGSYRSEPTWLNVKYPPTPDPKKPYQTQYGIEPNHPVKIKWSLIANPAPKNVYWSRNGKRLKMGEGYEYSIEKDRSQNNTYVFTLEFQARRRAYGVYSCLVANAIGRREAVFRVYKSRHSLHADIDEFDQDDFPYNFDDDVRAEEVKQEDTDDNSVDTSTHWGKIAIGVSAAALITAALVMGITYLIYRRRQNQVKYGLAPGAAVAAYDLPKPPEYEPTPAKV